MLHPPRAQPAKTDEVRRAGDWESILGLARMWCRVARKTDFSIDDITDGISGGKPTGSRYRKHSQLECMSMPSIMVAFTTYDGRQHFVTKMPLFSLPWQQESLAGNLNDGVKLADREPPPPPPPFDTRISELSPMKIELESTLRLGGGLQ